MSTGPKFGKDNEPYPPQLSGKFLFTGCPRSGTKSVAFHYRKNDLDIGHEQAGRDGTVEWRHAYYDKANFDITVIVVRDPIHTVVSLTDLLDKVDRTSWTWHYIKDLSMDGLWEDLLMDENHVGAAIQWWTSVYDRRFGLPTIKIEDFRGLPHENHHIKGNSPFLPTIKCDRFYEVASKYGYVY